MTKIVIMPNYVSWEVFDDCPRKQAPWGKERLTS